MFSILKNLFRRPEDTTYQGRRVEVPYMDWCHQGCKLMKLAEDRTGDRDYKLIFSKDQKGVSFLFSTIEAATMFRMTMELEWTWIK